MEKRKVSASVRTIVEFSTLSGSLLPGSQLSRAREGLLGHQARQKALPDARAEVVVRGQVEGEVALLDINGRIDVLYERDDVPVIEELKLAPPERIPEDAQPVHWAQAVCYGHMLQVPRAIIRVVYIRMDGTEVAAFEQSMDADAMEAAFRGYVDPYLHMVEARLLWMDVRDASIATLPFPFSSFRTGQRDMAVQAFWAIKSKKRLYVQAPTGTGKTAAALYPALKALGEGLTGQLFYLTARTTGQQNAAQALEYMRAQGLRVRALNMTAREKICPCAQAGGEGPWACDLLTCPYAIGFYDRLPDALEAMREGDDWSRAMVERVSEAFTVCPFEFSLSLCEEADAIICDYNYAFDPGARIRRIFLWNTNLTLLVDEAHNLPDRARGMLSAEIDERMLREVRRTSAKVLGRKTPLYEALTGLIRLLGDQDEGTGTEPHAALLPLLENAMEAALSVIRVAPLGELPRMLIAALGTLERFDEHYAVMTERRGRYKVQTLYCLDPAPHLLAATRKLRGTIYFSATLTPLPAWRDAIGGTEEDGMLSLLSPFPQENLLVLRYGLSTKYKERERTAGEVAEAILAVAEARPGNYLACFPSYAYMRRVQQEIKAREHECRLHVQQSGMDDAARMAYLDEFFPREESYLLGMVVMGGIFGEGIDLPGERLSGVIIVGVGLPQICPERELLRAYYDEQADTGFAQAYRYPGMNKVLQAVGRVIRTETDRGVALLIDDRFLRQEYASLMPPWWGLAEAAGSAADIRARMEAFWEK